MTGLLFASILGWISLTPMTGTAVLRQELPFKPPASWKVQRQDQATILTPDDVPEGKLYAVMVTMKTEKLGSLDVLLHNGRQMASEIGEFKPKTEPKPLQSEGGWDYQFVLGVIESPSRNFVAQLTAIRKGEQGGVLVTLSDSVETMDRYAEAFSKMLREMGGAKPATPLGAGKVDLQFTVPSGWVEQRVNGLPFLVKERNEDYTRYRMSLLILPTEELSGSLREAFARCWAAYVIPNCTTDVAPLPLMARLKSGYACAFDGDWRAAAKNGAEVSLNLYLVAHGGKFTPIVGTYAGPDWLSDKTAEAEIAQLLDTARIAGASASKVPLFSPSSLAGDWKESGTSFANYVTRSGAYAGDATISTTSYFTIEADGTYSRAFLAVGAAGNLREKDAGKWSVDDDELVLDKGGRYSLLGYGDDAKVGRFLVIGNYANQKTRLKFTNPRGPLQAMWMKAK